MVIYDQLAITATQSLAFCACKLEVLNCNMRIAVEEYAHPCSIGINILYYHRFGSQLGQIDDHAFIATGRRVLR